MMGKDRSKSQILGWLVVVAIFSVGLLVASSNSKGLVLNLLPIVVGGPVACFFEFSFKRFLYGSLCGFCAVNVLEQVACCMEPKGMLVLHAPWQYFFGVTLVAGILVLLIPFGSKSKTPKSINPDGED